MADSTQEAAGSLGKTKDDVNTLAKIAEKAERYEDMAMFMKRYVVEFEQYDLEDEDRNLLSVAYKNIVGGKRFSWKVLENENRNLKRKSKAAEAAGESVPENIPKRQNHVKTVKTKVKDELMHWCEDVVALLDGYLLKHGSDKPKVKVFYNKMKGDYYRYEVEVADDEEREAICKKSSEAYQKANEIARSDLKKYDPILLGLALNYSVFHYEIMQDSAKACETAQTCFDEALPLMDELQQSDVNMFKDSELILQLLRDNLSLWKADDDEYEQEDD